MAGHKGTSPAPSSRSAPKVVSPRNKVNVAFPFSRFTVQESAKITVGDWISLAGTVISTIGFSILIWQSIRADRKRIAGGPGESSSELKGRTVVGQPTSPEAGRTDQSLLAGAANPGR